MSDRERWIVYPLLFLALGVALRDKLTRTIDGVVLVSGKSTAINLDRGYVRTRIVDADLVRCGRIEVRDQTDKPLVILGGVDVPAGDGAKKTSGAISVHGQDGKEIIALRANHALKGELSTRHKPGEEAEIVFEVTEVKEDGGLLEVFDAHKTLSVVVAHRPLESGLFARNAKGQLARLSRVVRRTAAADAGADAAAAAASDPGPAGPSPPAESGDQPAADPPGP